MAGRGSVGYGDEGRQGLTLLKDAPGKGVPAICHSTHAVRPSKLLFDLSNIAICVLHGGLRGEVDNICILGTRPSHGQVSPLSAPKLTRGPPQEGK